MTSVMSQLRQLGQFDYDLDPGREFMFYIRIPGINRAALDHKPIGHTYDRSGYGKTEEEALANALKDIPSPPRS